MDNKEIEKKKLDVPPPHVQGYMTLEDADKSPISMTIDPDEPFSKEIKSSRGSYNKEDWQKVWDLCNEYKIKLI